jgi:hypothetical protein
MVQHRVGFIAAGNDDKSISRVRSAEPITLRRACVRNGAPLLGEHFWEFRAPYGSADVMVSTVAAA